MDTWLVKLDIRKACDSIWQYSLSELVAARVGGVPSARCPVPANGGGMPWEAMLWLSILEPAPLMSRYVTQSPLSRRQTGSGKPLEPSSPETSRRPLTLHLSREGPKGRSPTPPYRRILPRRYLPQHRGRGTWLTDHICRADHSNHCRNESSQ